MTIKRLPPHDWTTPGSEGSQTEDSVTNSRITLAGEDEIVPIAYGEVEISGKVILVSKSGEDLVVAVVWCIGPIESIVGVYLNDEKNSRVSIKNYLGRLNQSVDPTLRSIVGSNYTDDFIYRAPNGTSVGVAYSVIKIPPNVVSGFPSFKAHIKGRRVETRYTENPADVLLDLITDPILGLNRRVDTASFLQLAQDCDSQINGEPRRAIGLLVSSEQETERWVETLRTYASCTLATEGDLVKVAPLWAPVPTPKITITDKDTIKNSLKIEYKQSGTPATVITVSYTDKTSFPFTNSEVSYIPKEVTDGAMPWREERLSMPGIPTRSQAMREAQEHWRNLHTAPFRLSWKAPDEAIQFSVGDVIAADFKIGIAGVFRIIQMDVVEAGRWRITVEQYDSSIRSNAVAPPVPGYPILPPGSGGSGGSEDYNKLIANLELTEIFGTGNEDPPESKFRARWDRLASSTLARYEIQWQIDGVWSPSNTVALEEYVSQPIKTPENITFRVRAISTGGIESLWTLGSIYLRGRDNNINKPTSVWTSGNGDCFNPAAMINAIKIFWSFPIGVKNIKEVAVWYNTVPSSTGATFLVKLGYPTNNFTMDGVPIGQKYYFFVRFIDTNDNVGPWHSLNGTAGAPSCSATVLLEYLNGQIKESQLHQSLTTKIDEKLGPGSPAIVQMNQRIDGAYGEWTVKVQSQGYVAGIGLVADAEGQSGVRSAFLAQVDRFAVGHPSMGNEYPFIIQNGNVLLKKALIGEAWIETANIENLAVKNAKIGWNAATEMVGLNLGGTQFWCPSGIGATETKDYPYSVVNLDLSQAYAILVVVSLTFKPEYASGFDHQLELRMAGNVVRSATMEKQDVITYVQANEQTLLSGERVVTSVSQQKMNFVRMVDTMTYSTVFPVGSKGITQFKLSGFMRSSRPSGSNWPNVTYGPTNIAFLIAKK